MDIYGVVRKLVGEIEPVGETHTDGERFENLRVMTGLINNLIADIVIVAHYDERVEYSMNRAGKFARKFMAEIDSEEWR